MQTKTNGTTAIVIGIVVAAIFGALVGAFIPMPDLAIVGFLSAGLWFLIAFSWGILTALGRPNDAYFCGQLLLLLVVAAMASLLGWCYMHP